MPSLLGGRLLSWLVSLYDPSGSHLFAVLLGSTVDTCYVSLQRLLWVEFFVLSAMLGSTVALGDDFVAMVVFSAMLGSTLDTWCCQSTWPFHRCSSWTRLSCPDPEVHHSGGAAVAVPLQGRQHPRRCAGTASHGLTIQRPLRFSCSSTLTWWLMLVVRVRHASGAVCEETVEIPQLQLRCWTLSFTCLSLCNDRCLGWSRQCSNCGSSAVGITSWTG